MNNVLAVRYGQSETDLPQDCDGLRRRYATSLEPLPKIAVRTILHRDVRKVFREATLEYPHDMATVEPRKQFVLTHEPNQVVGIAVRVVSYDFDSDRLRITEAGGKKDRSEGPGRQSSLQIITWDGDAWY